MKYQKLIFPVATFAIGLLFAAQSYGQSGSRNAVPSYSNPPVVPQPMTSTYRAPAQAYSAPAYSNPNCPGCSSGVSPAFQGNMQTQSYAPAQSYAPTQSYATTQHYAPTQGYPVTQRFVPTHSAPLYSNPVRRYRSYPSPSYNFPTHRPFYGQRYSSGCSGY